MKIVLCFDNTTYSSYAFEWVVGMVLHPDDELELISAKFADEDCGGIMREYQKVCQESKMKCSVHLLPCESKADIGKTLCKYIDDHADIGLVAVGCSYKDTLTKLIIGSVGDAVLRHVHCPVLICKEPQTRHPIKNLKRHLMCAVDETKASRFAFEWMNTHLIRPDDLLSLVTVADTSMPASDHSDKKSKEGKAVLKEYATVLKDKMGRKCVEHLRSGPKAGAIVQCALEVQAELLILGAHDRSSFVRMLHRGIHAEVVSKSECPVLICKRPKGHD
eukprot:Rmarinus@m.16633